MKTFKVQFTIINSVEIEAENKEDALATFYAGDYNLKNVREHEVDDIQGVVEVSKGGLVE